MRKLFWRLHSIIGLLAGIGLLVIGVSGAILVFHEQIDTILFPERVVVEPLGQRRSLNELVAAVEKEFPDHAVTGWQPAGDSSRADGAYIMPFGTRDWLYITIDPYRAKVLSRPQVSESTLKGWMLALHSHFFLQDFGLAVVGLLGAALCFLGLSGLWLYRRFWKTIFRLRWKSSLRLFFGDFHRMVGVLSVGFNLMFGFTGAFWNLSHTLEHFAGEPHDPADEALFAEKLFPADLDVAAFPEKARQHLPGFRTHYISFPWAPGGPFTLWGNTENSGWFRSDFGSQVAFDSQTGNFISAHDLRQDGLWAGIKDSFEPIHFGSFGGIIVRLIWAIAGFFPALLTLSGMAIWWKRRHPRKSGKASPARTIPA